MLAEAARLLVIKAKDEGLDKKTAVFLVFMSTIMRYPLGKTIAAWRTARREVDSVWPQDG